MSPLGFKGWQAYKTGEWIHWDRLSAQENNSQEAHLVFAQHAEGVAPRDESCGEATGVGRSPGVVYVPAPAQPLPMGCVYVSAFNRTDKPTGRQLDKQAGARKQKNQSVYLPICRKPVYQDLFGCGSKLNQQELDRRF